MPLSCHPVKAVAVQTADGVLQRIHLIDQRRQLFFVLHRQHRHLDRKQPSRCPRTRARSASCDEASSFIPIEDRHPVEGWPCRACVWLQRRSRRHQATSPLGTRVDLVISRACRRKVGLGPEDVHVARHPPANRWSELPCPPFFSIISASFRTCAVPVRRHPYRGSEPQSGESELYRRRPREADPLLTAGPSTLRSDTAVGADPDFRTARLRRAIHRLRHDSDRMKPPAPSRAPAMIRHCCRSRTLSRSPQPLIGKLSIEITTAVAPTDRSTSETPKKRSNPPELEGPCCLGRIAAARS